MIFSACSAPLRPRSNLKPRSYTAVGCDAGCLRLHSGFGHYQSLEAVIGDSGQGGGNGGERFKVCEGCPLRSPLRIARRWTISSEADVTGKPHHNYGREHTNK